MKIWISILVGSWIFSAAAQIVNIESRRIVTDTTGLNGHADLNFFANKNAKTIYTLGSELQMQYKTKKQLFLLLGNINFTRSGNTDYLNDGFVHLRHNVKIHPRVRWEEFVQLQYNRLLLVRQRMLLGTGPRIKLLEKKKARLYLGVIGMYENEQLTNGESTKKDIRSSTYLSWTLAKDKKFSFTGTTYYQPLFNNFQDYRLSGQYNLMFFISQHLFFKNTVNYLYDSSPAIGAVNQTYSFIAGLGFIWK